MSPSFQMFGRVGFARKGSRTRGEVLAACAGLLVSDVVGIALQLGE